MNLLDELKTLLSHDPRFAAEGQLLKNAITEAALKLDPALLRLLLAHDRLKAHFFVHVDGVDAASRVCIFDKDKFLRFVNNKAFLPDSYTAFKNKIGLTTPDGRYLSESREVVLSWPYKDCVLEGGQTKEDARRNEIFWNETLAPDEIDRLLAPKVFTNFRRYDADGAGGERAVSAFTGEENLIIKGNNLLALHSLKKRFAGKVKLIYIDPPYNTGSEGDTFAYNNSFKHSTWLTFMQNRLEVAKSFLRDDGFIAIAIDHAELYYLGCIMDEIFGRENRVGLVTVLNNPKGRNLSKFFSSNSEFMLVYAKNIEMAEFNQVAISDQVRDLFAYSDEEGRYRYEPFMRARTVWSRQNKPHNWYPIYVSKDLKHITADRIDGYYELYPITNDGKEMAWKNIRKSFIELNQGDYFAARLEEGKVRLYHKYREQQVYKNVWTDQKYQSEFHGTNLLKKLLGPDKFSYPKSVYLIIDVLKITTSDDDLILDFFAGSGTTAHAVLDLNKEDGGQRQFILCEQMEYAESVTAERTKKVIEINKSGSFLYCELAAWNERFIPRIRAARSAAETLALWRELQAKAHLSYRVDIPKVNGALDSFAALPLEEQRRFLLEALDKNQLYIALSEMDDETYGVSEQDKALNRQFYGI